MTKLTVGVCLGLLSTFALSSCGSGSAKPSPGVGCALNSDCASGLICTFGLCHSACAVNGDCAAGMCVKGTEKTEAGVVTVNVCQLPAENQCYYNSNCMAPLVCGRDEHCRNQCVADVDCPPGEKCTASGVCALTAQIDPATGDVPLVTTGRTPDGGAYSGLAGATGSAGATGTAGATGAAGASGTAGASGSAGASGAAGKGAGGVGGSACSGPQLAFGSVAQGDPNALFTSAVSVRNADTLFIFSAYQGPATAPPDGGTDGGIVGNALFVQMFDPVTGDARGPAANITALASGPYLAVYDSSIAPTGEIALVYAVGSPQGGGFEGQLYALFLTVTQGDGGTAGLKIGRSVQLESVSNGDAHVIWEAHDNAFAFQWKYIGSGNGYYTKIQRYQTNGITSGLGIGTVPTNTGHNYPPSQEDDCYLGTSGSYLGVAFQPDGTTGTIDSLTGWLTIMDDEGFAVGSGFVPLSNPGQIGNWIAVGGTTQGFVGMFLAGSGVQGAFVPLTGAGDVVVDGGIGTIGDGGLPPLKTYGFASTASTGKLISDDTGGAGGVGMALLENDGATFIYVTADGGKLYNEGAVVSDGSPGEVNVSNYHGSFAVSIFDTATHAGKAVASGCP